MPGPTAPPYLWPGSPAYYAYFSNAANRHPPWGSGPPSPFPYHPPILSDTHAQTNGQGPYIPRRTAPPPTRNEPQGGISTYDQPRLLKWASDNSYPNHPRPLGYDHKRSAAPKHPIPPRDSKNAQEPKYRSSRPVNDAKHVDPRKGKNEKRPSGYEHKRSAAPKNPNPPRDSKHTKEPKQRSSRPVNDAKHVDPRKGKNEKRPERPRAERLVCDFCKKATPIYLDDGRRLCDICYGFRQGRLAGR